MTAPMQLINPGDHLQRMRRAGRYYTDQHGRKFFAMADAASQQPVEELRPSGWKAEWIPPMRFAKFQHDGDLNFVWQYDVMAAEFASEVASYYDAATKFALEHNLPVPEVGGVVDRRIKAVLEHPPMSPEIPLAAAAGDPGLLGMPGAVLNDDLKAILRQGTISTGNDALRAINERIAKRMGTHVEPDTSLTVTLEKPYGIDEMPPVTYQQFVAEGRKGGMSMADLAIAWKAHKDNTAAAA